MEPQSISLEHDLAGRKLVFNVGRFSTQASGSVTVSLGDTVILANVGITKEPREGADFFPMMVDFEEKYYAAGKIKGSRFIKREGRPSDNAILTSRLIDRPLRPLFPKGIYNEVQIICTVLSADLEVDPGTTGITAASAAVMLSGAPFAGPVASVRIGYVGEEGGKESLVVNPTYKQCEEGKMNLVVAGTMDAINMVEAAANEVSEEVILEALTLAHKHIKDLCKLQLDLKAKIKPEPLHIEPEAGDTAVAELVAGAVPADKLRAIGGKTKKEFKASFDAVLQGLIEKFNTELEEEKFSKGQLAEELTALREKAMRDDILAGKPRIDGRALDEIRSLGGELGVLPRTHGSALFTRGETHALSITTLGSPGAAQIIDTMDTDETRRYMHHYNFPPFSVGEVKPLRGPSRREIGHGNLAERAIKAVLPSRESFPYTMLVVSEILSCNGSSSMASVCGSSLSLMDAGVPLSGHVAGIAMGLVVSEDYDGSKGKGTYKVLTDIQGLEDFGGDMDFKVAGTKHGITALQMDIKVKGLPIDLLREALEKAKKGRMTLLDHLVKLIPAPREKMSPYAPMITSVRIDPDNIRDVIGKGGETIQKMCADFNVEIDIEDDGLVMITAVNQEGGQKALDRIKQITYEPIPGDVFDGTVVRIMDFGAFVEFVPGKDGLVHISKLAPNRVNKVTDVCKEGDKMKVKLVEVDAQGRYNLARVFDK